MNEILTTEEAAAELGVDLDTARKMLKSEIPVKFAGRSYLWSREQIQAIGEKRAARIAAEEEAQKAAG